jgi:hypothetical protein
MMVPSRWPARVSRKREICATSSATGEGSFFCGIFGSFGVTFACGHLASVYVHSHPGSVDANPPCVWHAPCAQPNFNQSPGRASREVERQAPVRTFFLKALLLIRITQNGRQTVPVGAHRNWTYRVCTVERCDTRPAHSVRPQLVHRHLPLPVYGAGAPPQRNLRPVTARRGESEPPRPVSLKIRYPSHKLLHCRRRCQSGQVENAACWTQRGIGWSRGTG